MLTKVTQQQPVLKTLSFLTMPTTQAVITAVKTAMHKGIILALLVKSSLKTINKY
jgi:hypothetical protein